MSRKSLLGGALTRHQFCRCGSQAGATAALTSCSRFATVPSPTGTPKTASANSSAARLLTPILAPREGGYDVEQIGSFAQFIDGLAQHHTTLAKLAAVKQDALAERLSQAELLFASWEPDSPRSFLDAHPHREELEALTYAVVDRAG